jgi:putative ABC transport system permease protein
VEGLAVGFLRRIDLYVRLSVQQWARRPTRIVLLVVAVAVASAAAFCALVLHETVAASVTGSLDRLGADLLVLPSDSTVNLTSTLLTVEPSDRLLDVDAARRFAGLPGIERAAPQRVLVLPSAEGHADAAVVAFDPSNDFTVLPWVVERSPLPFSRNDLILGARRQEHVGSIVTLFGHPFRVWGKLGLTGVGPFERASFASFETATHIAEAAKSSTQREIWAPDDARVSALLVRLRPGSRVEQIRFQAAEMPQLQVVAGNGVHTAVHQALSALLRGSIVVSVATLLATVVLVGLLYSAILAERRRDLGLLLSIGIRPRELLTFVLVESAATTALGGVCGALLGGGALMLWQRSIGFALETSSVPLVLPGASVQVMAGAACAAICAVMGIAGAAVPAWRASLSEPYALVREEGA